MSTNGHHIIGVMLARVGKYIDDNRLFDKSDKVLVALSGGGDSVALLDILQQSGYKCVAAHCNFHLRGEESDLDQSFVESLAKKYNTELRIKHFDTKAYSRQHGISIEMAARDLRYEWLEQTRRETSCKVIAVAHHKDDQAETLLLNLYRASGIRGLRAMLPKNGNIVRPLLCTTHRQLLDYLQERGLDHREDTTNSDTAIRRNAIRKQLQSQSEAETAHIAQTAEYMQQYVTLIDEYINSIKSDIVKDNKILIQPLLHTPAPKAVLYELLREYGFAQTDDIYEALEGQAGKVFHSDCYTLLKDRDALIISKRDESAVDQPKIEYYLSDEIPTTFPSAQEWSAVVDAVVLKHPLTLRHWKQGDWFIPIGLKKKKKISDFFTDMHIPRTEKDKIWLLCSGEDIVWIAGYRLDDRYKITPKTKQALRINLSF